MLEHVRRHLQRDSQYFGVSGSLSSVRRYRECARRLLLEWRNRRSQFWYTSGLKARRHSPTAGVRFKRSVEHAVRR